MGLAQERVPVLPILATVGHGIPRVVFMGCFMRSFLMIAAGMIVCLSSSGLAAQEVKETVENGILYRTTKQVMRRPMTETRWEEQKQTVFREQYDTQWQTSYRTLHTPVIEYQAQAYLANRWNPFGTPYWSYRYVPITRWEMRQEPMHTPITQRNWVPVEQTVHVPRTNTHLVEEEVISKVAVGPVGGSSALARQSGNRVSLDSDESTAWKSASGSAQR
jgi:hypothetical protein